jgi:integrase
MSAWKNRNAWRWRVMVCGHIATGSARTREAALAAEASARRELIASDTGIQPRRTLDEAVVRYLESPEYLSLKSASSVADKLGTWAGYIAGHAIERAPDIAERAVRDWLGRELAIATINRRLAALRRVLALAYRRWQWIGQDIAVRIPLLPGENQRQVWLTRAEAMRLRRACPPGHIRGAITLLLTTGLRVGELLALRAEQIRDGAIYLDARTKTGRPRGVPILPPGNRYTRHVPLGIGYDGLRSAFDRAKRRAGLPAIRLHDLRHTVGSLLAEAGGSLRDIQVWLGHTSPTTTMRYTHVEMARLQHVASQVHARNLRAKQGAKGASGASVTRETQRHETAK